MAELTLSLVLGLLCILLALYLRYQLRSVFIFSAVFFLILLPWLTYIASSELYAAPLQQVIAKYASISFFMFSFAVSCLLLPGDEVITKRWFNLNICGSRPPDIVLVAAYICIWGFRIYRAVNYGILFSGSATAERILAQGYLTSVLVSLIMTIQAGLFAFLVIRLRHHPFMLAFFVAAELTWAMVAEGRRAVIFLLLVIFLIWITVFGRRKPVQMISGTLSCAVLLYYVLTPVFVVGRSEAERLLASSTSVVTATLEGFKRGLFFVWDNPQYASVIIRENLDDRGNASEFLSDMIWYMSRSGDFGLGSGLATALLWVVPSSILDKPLLPVEQYIQYRIGMPIGDRSVSWVALAYADFGVVGSLIYGFLFGAALLFIFRIANHLARPGLEKCIVLFGLVGIAYNVEGDPMDLFVFMRNVILAIVLLRCTYWGENRPPPRDRGARRLPFR